MNIFKKKMMYSNEELYEKIRIFCDMNEVIDSEKWHSYIDFLVAKKATGELGKYSLFSWNTDDYLAQGLYDLVVEKIDDATFFQIGDVESYLQPKQDRPHLSALVTIEEESKSNSIYLVDKAAVVAYQRIHGEKGLQDLQEMLASKNSALIAL